MHACAELGAVFFHIHARDENNKPTMHPHIFREICRLVKERDPDVIIQISTWKAIGTFAAETRNSWVCFSSNRVCGFAIS